MKTIINHPIFTRKLLLLEHSAHGIGHWKRVEYLGLEIAKENGADKKVISLFAYLHDARRKKELNDRSWQACSNLIR